MKRRYLIRRIVFLCIVLVLISVPLSYYLSSYLSLRGGTSQQSIRNEIKIKATLLPVVLQKPVRIFVEIETSQQPDFFKTDLMDLVLLTDGNKVPYKPISFQESKRSDTFLSGTLVFPSFSRLPKELSLIIYELEPRIFLWQLDSR